MWNNLPNSLTIVRILLVPLTVWSLLQGYYASALAAFLLAGLTDGLDGYLARRFNLQTELGAYLDPLADKALLVSVFGTLAILQALPMWLALVVVTRDVLIVSAVLLSRYMGRPVTVKPLFLSKVNTFVQIAFVVMLLTSLATSTQLPKTILAGATLVAVLTVTSFAVYMNKWLAHMGDNTSGKS